MSAVVGSQLYFLYFPHYLCNIQQACRQVCSLYFRGTANIWLLTSDRNLGNHQIPFCQGGHSILSHSKHHQSLDTGQSFPPIMTFNRILPLLLLVTSVTATLTNRTIDDQYGDSVTRVPPSYSPSGGWSRGAKCSTCAAQPNASQAYGGSWHDSTHHPTDPEPRIVSLSFNGE